MSLSRLSTLLALAGIALAAYALGRSGRRPDHAQRPSPEELLDEAVEETFPASDPIAVSSAYRRASRKT